MEAPVAKVVHHCGPGTEARLLNVAEIALFFMVAETSVRTFKIPGVLKVGTGALASIGDSLEEVGARRPLVVTDKVMGGSDWMHRILESCRDHGAAVSFFDQIDAEPTVIEVDAALKMYEDGDCDSVIGFGGGSALDVAKSVAVLATNGGSIVDYEGREVIPRAGVPVIAIPTTSGTGSEASRYVAITDPVRDVKMLITSDFLLPTAALVDPGPTASMPPSVTASTGIDALTHAVEAYVAKMSSPMSDAMALSAISAISRNLAQAFGDPDDLEARSAMSVAALQAGMAFSNASVALVHAMARPLGAHFHIPHGVSNAMLLEVVMNFSMSSAPARYSSVGRAMGATSDRGATDGFAHGAVRSVGDLCRKLRIPSLAEWGVEESRLKELAPKMAQDAVDSGSPANNPRVPSVGEIVSLYDEAYSR